MVFKTRSNVMYVILRTTEDQNVTADDYHRNMLVRCRWHESGVIAGQPDNLFCLITHFCKKILPHVKIWKTIKDVANVSSGWKQWEEQNHNQSNQWTRTQFKYISTLHVLNAAGSCCKKPWYGTVKRYSVLLLEVKLRDLCQGWPQHAENLPVASSCIRLHGLLPVQERQNVQHWNQIESFIFV